MSTGSQEKSGPHFTNVGDKPGCEHGVSMDEDCEQCLAEIEAYEAYEAKLDEQFRAFEASQRCPLCRGFIPEECDGVHRDDSYAEALS